MNFVRSTPILNYLSGAVYRMVRTTEIVQSTQIYDQIAEECNRTPVYENLFRAKLNEEKYQPEHAEAFLNWANNGWQSNTHFVFVLISPGTKSVVGCVDIKSADLNCAEIGYWSSETVRGLMTNTITTLCSEAKQVGFRKFLAKVIRGNSKSVAVLSRTGFCRDRIESSKNTTHDIYYKHLS